MILPGTGRGTVRRKANGGGGSSLRKPEVYAARRLRRAMSLPETLLWRELRGDRLGFRVRRQHPFGPYVADFYVSAARLVIEIDGEAHNRADRPDKDEKRDCYMRAQGLQLLRVPAVEVLKNLTGVLQGIVARVASPLHHRAALDGPPPRAGEDL